MALFSAFLFDLDGVIVDTAKYHYLAWKEIAGRFGFDFTPEQNELLKGVGRMESLDILLRLGNVEPDPGERELLAAEKNERYLRLCERITPADLLPGVKPFLDEIRSAGLRTGIGSASRNARFILGKLEISASFDAIIDGNCISKGKPDPEIFLLGASALDEAPARCVVFEDAAAGIAAAKAAGMYAVGIGAPENLPGADLVIPGFASFGLAALRARIS